MSFRVKPGEVVALVGAALLQDESSHLIVTPESTCQREKIKTPCAQASGAGKSTVLKLCARLADPQDCVSVGI